MRYGSTVPFYLLHRQFTQDITIPAPSVKSLKPCQILHKTKLCVKSVIYKIILVFLGNYVYL